MCISTFGPFASPSNFPLCTFGCHIFFSKIVRFLLPPVVDMFSYHPLSVVEKTFFVVLKCPVLSVLFYSLSISF